VLKDAVDDAGAVEAADHDIRRDTVEGLNR
jgi:hypothetical protein